MRIRAHVFLWLGIAGAALALFAGGCGSDTASRAMPEQEVSYLVVSVRPATLKTVLSGRTSALEMAEVRPQVSGIIQKRLFTEGTEVREGQQLYQIDPALYEVQLAEAKAALLRAEVGYNTARLLAERNSAAVKVNAVSRQEYDNAIAGRNQAQAEVVAAKAAVDAAAINLRYTRVKAPITGHIGISSVTPGALVTANQGQPLAVIQHFGHMYVDVTQSSTEILRLKRAMMAGRLASSGDGGARVSLILEDGSAYDLPGVLELTDVTVNTGTGTVTLRAKFENPLREIAPGRKERLLFPGMFVRAVLEEAVDTAAVMLPQIAVGRDSMGRATVYILDDGVVREAIVSIERTIGNEYMVSSGLKAGDKVIVDGRIKVRPGMKVRGVPYAPPDGEAQRGDQSAAGR